MADLDGFAAIWDMDGTLVDTAEQHFQTWQVLCRELGREFTRDDFAATFGKRNPEIFQILFPDTFTGEELDRHGDRKESLYRNVAREGVALLPGVGSLLEGFARSGWKQAIGSSAPHANLELLVETTGIGSYFSAIVGAEDTERGKPDPQVFLVASERVGVVPEKCVVFEDAIAGVQAAKAGGMKCVAVSFVGHHPEEALREAGADLVVGNLELISVENVQGLFVS